MLAHAAIPSSRTFRPATLPSLPSATTSPPGTRAWWTVATCSCTDRRPSLGARRLARSSTRSLTSGTTTTRTASWPSRARARHQGGISLECKHTSQVYPTDPFTFLELQNARHDVPGLFKFNRSPNHGALEGHACISISTWPNISQFKRHKIHDLTFFNYIKFVERLFWECKIVNVSVEKAVPHFSIAISF